MGVDYEGVDGVGIEFTDGMAEKAIEAGIFTKNDWEEDRSDCVDQIGVTFSKAGNEYSGETSFYLFVNGGTLGDINANAEDFVNIVSKFLPDLSVDDLEIIEDIYIY